MAKKEVLRKIGIVFSLIWLFKITVEFFLNKADTFSIVCMIICYIAGVFWLVRKTIIAVNSYNQYENFEKDFHDITFLYLGKCFSETQEDVESYSKAIERYHNALVELGESYIVTNSLSKKQTKKVQDMINQAKKQLPELLNNKGLI